MTRKFIIKETFNFRISKIKVFIVCFLGIAIILLLLITLYYYKEDKYNKTNFFKNNNDIEVSNTSATHTKKVQESYTVNVLGQFIKYMKPVFDFNLNQDNKILLTKIIGKAKLKASEELAQYLLSIYVLDKCPANNEILYSYEEMFSKYTPKKRLFSKILKATNNEFIELPISWGDLNKYEYGIVVDSCLVIIADGGTPQTGRVTTMAYDLEFTYKFIDFNTIIKEDDYINVMDAETCWGFIHGCQISTPSTNPDRNIETVRVVKTFSDGYLYKIEGTYSIAALAGFMVFPNDGWWSSKYRLYYFNKCPLDENRGLIRFYQGNFNPNIYSNEYQLIIENSQASVGSSSINKKISLNLPNPIKVIENGCFVFNTLYESVHSVPTTEEFQINLFLRKNSIKPKGYFDSINCLHILGWACDSKDYSAPLEILIYIDGPINSGRLLVNGTANLEREEAVGNECGGFKNKGFVINLPPSIYSSGERYIYVYAKNIDSIGETEEHTLLKGSPKIFNTNNCTNIIITTSPTPTPTPTPTSTISNTSTPTPSPIITFTLTPTPTTNDFMCRNGTNCYGQEVVGKLNEVVCGKDNLEYKCTSTGWKNLGTKCSCFDKNISCNLCGCIDCNNDGKIDIIDFSCFARRYNTICQQNQK